MLISGPPFWMGEFLGGENKIGLSSVTVKIDMTLVVFALPNATNAFETLHFRETT